MRRISIRSVMAFVVVAGIGMAAIRVGSAPWSGAMYSITFFVMVCSLLGVALTRGMRRVYWSGFAALGWSYLVLMHAPRLDSEVGPFLLARQLFPYLAEVLDADAPGGGGLQSVPVGPFGAAATAGGFGAPVGGAGGRDLMAFVRIGEAIEALLWAYLGGWVACYFASGNRDESRPQAAATPPGAR